MGAEDMALGLELRPPLRIIEQLAIADDGDGAVLVEDRLPPVLEPENAQAAMGKAKTRCEQEAGIVGPAMGERRAHPLHHGLVGLLATFEVDHACQAAHSASLKFSPEQGRKSPDREQRRQRLLC